MVAQFAPYLSEGIDVFMGVCGRDGDEVCVAQSWMCAEQWPAESVGVGVGEHKDLIVTACRQGDGKILVEGLLQDDS